MKITPFSVIVFLLILTTSQVAYSAAGDNFSLDSTEGKIELNQLKGKVVYVDFWASWCAPCRKSFPWMNKMQSKYETQGLKIIGVSLDSEKSVTTKFLKKNPALFTIAYDPDGKVADNYNVQVMPTSYLIGRNGEVLMTHRGFRSKQKDALEAEIKKALSH